MNKKENIISKLYNYLIVDISENEEIGFEAIIPKFPKLRIMADTPAELHEIVKIAIEEELKYLKKNKKQIPLPDFNKFSGKFVLRLKPEIHERLSLLSKASGKTLNQYLNYLIESQIL